MRTSPAQQVATRLWLSLLLALLLLSISATAHPATAGAATATATTIRRLPTNEPVVALTFDTDTVRGYTSSVLDTLAARGVQATFGVTGTFAANNPDLIARMVADGHVLMNHSWSHPWFTDISSAERLSQLQRTENVVRKEVGVELQPYFRPPGGFYNAAVLADLAAAGYRYNVMWSVDAQGWRGKSAAQITQETLAAIQPGAIVLQHTFVAGDAGALGTIIDQLRARGYRFATVADYLGGTAPPPGPPTELYFLETGHWLRWGFLNYWWTHGQLPVFGYPLTDEFTDSASGLTVQYFERARFEWHPENAGTSYEVLLGLLGRTVTAGREGEAPFLPVQGSNDAHCTYFSATGHRLCFGFRDYWSARGGLAIFGYPISEEFPEVNPDTGQTYIVQYFERARFEWHPEKAPPWNVLLGRLGAEVLAGEPR
jgi:peptidoglycan/xylan/chitin deacetylase (PgdA/CDA1 family)